MPNIPRNIDKTMTGSNIQIVIPTTKVENGVTNRLGDIFVFNVTFESDVNNSNPIYIGCATGTWTTPSAPAALGPTNSLASLLPGQSFYEEVDTQNSRLGDLLALSRYYANGTASDKLLISYKERVQ